MWHVFSAIHACRPPLVKAPVLAYKPKKGGETDPEIAPILKRGMRYVAEFASAEGGSGGE